MKTVAIVIGTSVLVGCGSSGSGEPPDAGSVVDAPTLPTFDATLPSSDAATSTSLVATIRDFKKWDAQDPATNPDFENVPGSCNPCPEKGIVANTLGGDGKPVYAGGGSVTTHGKASFDAWYRSVPGTNVEVAFPMSLSPMGSGAFGYDSKVSGVPLAANDPTKNFFPIDDGSPQATSFGNQGDPHNYAFTVEIHTRFVYRGGEYFSFSGDDDVFVFIAGKLVIDLGGIHAPLSANVQVDSLGLTVGKTYALDFFSAERHRTQSNLLFTTTLDLQPAPK